MMILMGAAGRGRLPPMLKERTRCRGRTTQVQKTDGKTNISRDKIVVQAAEFDILRILTSGTTHHLDFLVQLISVLRGLAASTGILVFILLRIRIIPLSRPLKTRR